MAVLRMPDLGAQAPWMRQAFLVLVLAEAGQDGAETAVPGSELHAEPPLLVRAG